MPEKSLNVRGVEWRYANGGRGEQTILLLHGAVGGAESIGRLAEGFADQYRTLAPTIADVHTLDEACDALSAILDREHVGRAVVFGGSFGGALAQAFVWRHRRQVEHLVLLGASLPNREAGAGAARMSKFLRLLPFPLTRALLKLEASKALDAPAPPDVAARVAEFRQRLDEYFDHDLTRSSLLSRLALSVDFNRKAPRAPGDLEVWPGRVLIVEATDDPAVPAEERRRLREAYPRALVCAFAGAAEIIPVLRLEELVGVVKAFLKEDYSSPSDIVAECAVTEGRAACPGGAFE